MEYIFNLVRNENYGGVISPNKLLFKIISAPRTIVVEEVPQKVLDVYYKIYFQGELGEGENLRNEHIMYREENHVVPFQLLGALPFIEEDENVKAQVNGFLSTLTFKGFLKDFILQIP